MLRLQFTVDIAFNELQLTIAQLLEQGEHRAEDVLVPGVFLLRRLTLDCSNGDVVRCAEF